ncbi:MAG: restriction endonuclease subunit S [Chitinivibrionales bacterium]|nr:restriction endonuclease subunit S [Chitinivibrionales bacterium]
MRKTVCIEDVAVVNPSLVRKVLAEPERPVSFLPMAGVSEDGVLVHAEERMLSEVARGYRYFGRGDILVAKITPCMENGKALFAEDLPHDIGFGSTEFHVLRPKGDVDPQYLFFAIWNPLFRHVAEKNMTGTAGQRRVPTEFLRKYRIPFPSKEEQHRIAICLRRASGILRKRRDAIGLCDELLQSVFLEMFGDPTGNPKGWKLMELSRIGTITTGNTPSRARPEYYSEGVEWIKSDNINTPSHFLARSAETLSPLGESVGRVVPAGSILVTCIAGSRDCIGNAAIADRRVAFNQQINAITPAADVEPFFLYTQLLVGKRLIQTASTDSMKGLVSKSKFAAIRVMVPPKKEQGAFVKVFRRIQAELRIREQALEASEALFASVVQRAFGAGQ